MRGTFIEHKGLTYQLEFINEYEEQRVVRFVERVALEQVMMQGQAAKRAIKQFRHQPLVGSFRCPPVL